MITSNHIKAKAKAIGFDLVGITSAAPFSRAQHILRKRKEKNQLPDFMHKNIEILTTPQLHLDSARSIISLVMSYNHEIKEEGEVYLARYARGQDYHQVLIKKMEKLVYYLKDKQPELEVKTYTDTGPLLEKEIAQRAGIGWIGKNTNLINPEYGSYLVLGEIITNLKLKEDKPMKNYCYQCQLCLDNCPGNALEQPYYLNSKKCISYLTQKKGILTEEERKLIGLNLWGCDQCQEVCPYNKITPINIHSEYKPLIKGDIEKILNFNKNNFPEKWRQSALSWRGLRILKRNVLINIGNSGHKKFLTNLKNEITHPSPILRSYAIWAYEKIDNFSSRTLNKLKSSENDKRVLREINKIIDERNKNI